MTFISHCNRGEAVRSRRFKPARRWLAQLWEAVVDFAAPYGYQDDDGFHFGVPASVSVNRAKWYRDK